MTLKHNTASFCSLIILFGLLFTTSCTFDYFEDETNYMVYVPKADKNLRTEDYQIEDLRILIYNGQLEQEKYYLSPFNNNPRSRVGNFNFHLYPGEYSVYCFGNTTGFSFYNLDSYENARFALEESTDGYKEPSNTLLCTEYRKPNVGFIGTESTDTILFEKKYVGKICIAFKNLVKFNALLNFNNISSIKIKASGVGTYQKLVHFTDSINTRSSRNSAEDKMLLIASKGNNFYENPYSDYEFGIHNYYLPSLYNDSIINEPIHLALDFIGNNDKIIYTLYVDLIENQTPIILHMNQTIYVGVDGNKVFTLPMISPQNWNENIESGGNTSPGEGGIEI